MKFCFTNIRTLRVVRDLHGERKVNKPEPRKTLSAWSTGREYKGGHIMATTDLGSPTQVLVAAGKGILTTDETPPSLRSPWYCVPIRQPASSRCHSASERHQSARRAQALEAQLFVRAHVAGRSAHGLAGK